MFTATHPNPVARDSPDSGPNTVAPDSPKHRCPRFTRYSPKHRCPRLLDSPKQKNYHLIPPFKPFNPFLQGPQEEYYSGYTSDCNFNIFSQTIQYNISLPTLSAEAGEQSSLQGSPDPVGEIEECSLHTEHEGHPLVVRGVGGLVTALHSLI